MGTLLGKDSEELAKNGVGEENLSDLLESTPEDLETESIETPEETALRIPVVLDTVVKYLELQDLKTFRLVNSIWNLVASQWMLRGNNNHLYAPLHFQKMTEFGKYCLCYTEFNDILVSRYYYPIRSLDELVQCLRSSTSRTNFPCSSFGFIGDAFRESGLTEFLSLHGSKITRLVLSPPIYQDIGIFISQGIMKKILVDKVPNVEVLEIGAFQEHHQPFFPSTDPADVISHIYSNSGLIDLYHLKTLTCLNTSTCYSAAFELIGSCPNLESVYNFKPHYARAFLQGPENTNTNIQRVKAVKQFEFKLDILLHTEMLRDMENILDNWNYFAQTQPQLNHLTIPFNNMLARSATELRMKFTYLLNSILESSKDSLKILEVDTFNFLPYIHLPQLKNVKTLRFLSVINEDKANEFMPIFPGGTNLSHVFPSLHSVVCDFVCDSESIKKYFPLNSFNGVWPTVHSLEVVLPTSFDKLSELMPNVKKLTVNPLQSIKYEFAFLHLVYPNVEEIHIKCPRGMWLTDSELTGIPEADCASLRVQKEVLENFYEIYKIDTSILDFKNLKRLRISISNRNLKEDESEIQLLSHISGLVFQKNPNLQVIIGYNQYCPSTSRVRRALNSVAPYVQLVHENFKQNKMFHDIFSALHR